MSLVKLLREYDFKDEEISSVLDGLYGVNVDLDEARKILQFLKDEEIIEIKKVREKLAGLIAKSRANSLQNIKKVLDRNKFNSKELLAKAGSILTDATSKEVDNMIIALNNAGVDSEKVLKKYLTHNL